MKKLLPLLFVVSFATTAFSQVCVRDSSILLTGALLSPAYWDTITKQYNLNDACVNHPYNQSITINVPSTFSGIPINFVSVPTTGAILDLPIGLTYTCDPPNCVFNKSTLACIRIFGTPTIANVPVPDTFDLKIKVTINASPLGVFALDFPEGIPNLPNPHYYLALKNEQCLVGTYDQNSSLGYVKNAPNPFSNETTITVESIVPGDFQFEVFDLVGQRLHAQLSRLDAGVYEFSFDGSHLPNGSYFYSIGNRDGKVSRRLVVAR